MLGAPLYPRLRRTVTDTVSGTVAPRVRALKRTLVFHAPAATLMSHQ